MVSCGADIHCNCFPGDEAGGREEFERREGGKRGRGEGREEEEGGREDKGERTILLHRFHILLQ